MTAATHAFEDLGEPEDDSPMQRVRLDTAYGHVLLSDAATRNDGLSVLDQAAHVARQYGLSHQVRSIEGIRQGQQG